MTYDYTPLVDEVINMIVATLADQEAAGCRCRECWKPTAEQIIKRVELHNVESGRISWRYTFLTERTPDGGLKL